MGEGGKRRGTPKVAGIDFLDSLESTQNAVLDYLYCYLLTITRSQGQFYKLWLTTHQSSHFVSLLTGISCASPNSMLIQTKFMTKFGHQTAPCERWRRCSTSCLGN